ncbi:MAG: hypothetical protein EXQ94_09735 [Alphaproteobacteria bacterium]|nr:hypothetical protein [Alphaproteobacteria bacterium]
MATRRPAEVHVPREQKKTINVALQGGGAHGAFTWGVLERLAQEHRIFMTGFSGTSAGAMNGVVFVDGFIKAVARVRSRRCMSFGAAPAPPPTSGIRSDRRPSTRISGAGTSTVNRTTSSSTWLRG